MTDLPTPDPASLEHSEAMLAHLCELIDRRDGFLSFAEFMHECLYAPGLGYYVAGTRKFGEDGDFVTAPELTPLFGHLLARQIASLGDELPRYDVLELGAGTGQLALHVLERLAELGALPERYQILEASPELADRQRHLLTERLPAFANRIEWLKDIPGNFQGVVLANEVLDALPVERFAIENNGVWQLGVGAVDNRLVEKRREAPEYLRAAVDEICADLQRTLPDGFISEVCLAATPWVQELASGLQKGLLLFIDYGVDRETYYREDRAEGWLRCHFRHHAHNDALLYPGIQDLTSWVDFSAVASAGLAAGAQVAGYVSQAHFLLSAGLDQELSDLHALPEQERLRIAGAVRKLMMPGDMGESFKCLGLTKNIDSPPALTHMDRTHTL